MYKNNRQMWLILIWCWITFNRNSKLYARKYYRLEIKDCMLMTPKEKHIKNSYCLIQEVSKENKFLRNKRVAFNLANFNPAFKEFKCLIWIKIGFNQSGLNLKLGLLVDRTLARIRHLRLLSLTKLMNAVFLHLLYLRLIWLQNWPKS